MMKQNMNAHIAAKMTLEKDSILVKIAEPTLIIMVKSGSVHFAIIMENQNHLMMMMTGAQSAAKNWMAEVIASAADGLTIRAGLEKIMVKNIQKKLITFKKQTITVIKNVE